MPATWPPRTVIRKSSGLRTLESALYRGGLGPVAGVDEVGRGACAGPLVVAACVLGPEPAGEPGRARRLQEAQREGARAAVSADPPLCAGLSRGVHPVGRGGSAGCARGQHRGHAARGGGPVGAAGLCAVATGSGCPGLPMPSLPVVGGDAAAACIAAASVLAKVSRDRLMVEMEAEHPGYGFAEHKGYSTPAHSAALAELGPVQPAPVLVHQRAPAGDGRGRTGARRRAGRGTRAAEPTRVGENWGCDERLREERQMRRPTDMKDS